MSATTTATEARVPKVSDRVTVQIAGAPETGTLLSGGIRVGPGAAIRVPGKIIADYGDKWLVELDVSFDGRTQIFVPKGTKRS